MSGKSQIRKKKKCITVILQQLNRAHLADSGTHQTDKIIINPLNIMAEISPTQVMLWPRPWEDPNPCSIPKIYAHFKKLGTLKTKDLS